MATPMAISKAMAVAVACLAFVAACSDGDGELRGLVRTPPLQVGDTSVTDVSSGQPSGPFALRAAAGQLLIVYFGYTSCPDVCPTTLADVATALKDANASQRVRLAMVTVDPQRDTPEVLTTYVAHFNDRAIALQPADDRELEAAQAPFLASSEVTTNAEGVVEVSHTAVTYVVDAEGAVRVEWSFGTPPQDMAHDLRVLLQDIDKEQ